MGYSAQLRLIDGLLPLVCSEARSPTRRGMPASAARAIRLTPRVPLGPVPRSITRNVTGSQQVDPSGRTWDAAFPCGPHR